MGSTKKVRE